MQVILLHYGLSQQFIINLKTNNHLNCIQNVLRVPGYDNQGSFLEKL